MNHSLNFSSLNNSFASLLVTVGSEVGTAVGNGVGSGVSVGSSSSRMSWISGHDGVPARYSHF